jgi:uncharacterized protein (TIGR03790 family)
MKSYDSISLFVRVGTILFCVGFFLCLFIVSSPSVTRAAYYNDYSDTLLVVNDNSTTSVAIGAYFKAARNLSDSQIVHINTVTTEDVSRTEYNNNIRDAIRSFMTAHNIASTTNYIILTKGVPITLTDNTYSVDSILYSPRLCRVGIHVGKCENPRFSHILSA